MCIAGAISSVQTKSMFLALFLIFDFKIKKADVFTFRHYSEGQLWACEKSCKDYHKRAKNH